METENESNLEFLNLRLKLKGRNKITVDVYSKPLEVLHMSTIRPVTLLEM